MSGPRIRLPRRSTDDGVKRDRSERVHVVKSPEITMVARQYAWESAKIPRKRPLGSRVRVNGDPATGGVKTQKQPFRTTEEVRAPRIWIQDWYPAELQPSA